MAYDFETVSFLELPMKNSKMEVWGGYLHNLENLHQVVNKLSFYFLLDFNLNLHVFDFMIIQGKCILHVFKSEYVREILLSLISITYYWFYC